jgi:hypothetical protein
MLRLFTGTILLTCFACLAAAQYAGDTFTLQRLLERYTKSYGGVRDANQLASISIEGVQIQNGVAYDFDLRKKRPGMMHYQLKKGATTLTTVYNGRQAWLQVRKGSEGSVEELSDASLETVEKEARFDSPLYRHQEQPDNKITLEGREQVGLFQAFVLRVEEPGALTSRYYLHPENSLVLRIDRLDENGGLVLQTLYRDYKDVDGYPFAHVVENRSGGETISVTRVHSILVNPGLLSFYFEKPGK